ncbi:MAG: hypothetical protein ACRCZ0_09715 [Cetobacterium sp.]
MDDIMILMNAINIDIQGFNETQFGIFNDADQEKLLDIWNNLVDQDINKFIGKLSPEQKYKLTLWACNRTSYCLHELISAMEKFTKYLKSSAFHNKEYYPIPPKLKKNKFSIFKKKNLH